MTTYLEMAYGDKSVKPDENSEGMSYLEMAYGKDAGKPASYPDYTKRGFRIIDPDSGATIMDLIDLSVHSGNTRKQAYKAAAIRLAYLHDMDYREMSSRFSDDEFFPEPSHFQLKPCSMFQG